MRAQKRNDDITQIVAEACSLLGQLTWDTQRGAYLRGEKVCILLDPCPAEEGDRFDVPITILPLVGRATALEGISVVLRGDESDEAMIYYGLLNRRGQVLFRGLEKGRYRAEILPPEPVAWPMPFLVPVPSLAMVPSARTDEHRWRRRFRNADGSLVATLRERETGELELLFEAEERSWDSALVGVTWTPMSAEGEAATEPQRLFAVLAWSEVFGACVAEVHLGPMPQELELSLPQRPWPLESLTGEFIEALADSVARASTDHSRQAWRRLAQREEALPPEARRAIEEALGG